MIQDNETSTTHLKQVSVENLEIGMYVSKLDRPWLESSFLFQGFELKTPEDIKTVQEQCEYVFVDSSKHSKALKSTARNTAYSKGWLENRVPPQKRKTFSQEIDHASYVYGHTSTVVKSFMQEVKLGGTINVEIAKAAVAECVNSVLNQPDALIWMSQLKSRDEYTAQHSMNVCVYAIALGRQINLPESELHHIGLCGMMHDMGKMRVPLEILNKPGKLTEQEFKIMQDHTTIGWKLLMSSRGMYSGAVDVAYTHHEQLDGKGYPRGLTDEQISPYARMVAIVDMYDAITSDRVYQNGRTHLEAINIMTKVSGQHLYAGLLIKFIECLGIYPPGSIVELSSGEVAIVIEVNSKAKIRPIILILLNEDKQPHPERIVDMTKLDVDHAGQPYTIKRMARADEFKLDLKSIYSRDLLRKKFAEAKMA